MKFPRDTDTAIQPGDTYIDADTGLMVLTAQYLTRRGYCCNSGCRHCPYPKDGKGQPSTSRPSAAAD